MLRRQSVAIQKHDVPIVLPAWISADTLAIIICEVVKFLLYARGQIPAPYDQLYRQYVAFAESMQQAGNKKLRMTSLQRRTRKLLEQTEDVFVSLQNQFSEHVLPHYVLLAFGPTPIRPKELYNISLPRLTLDPGNTTAPPNEKQLVDFVRRLTRTLVMQYEHIAAWEACLDATSLFALTLGPVCCSDEIDPYVFPKKNFELSAKTKLQVNISLEFAPAKQPSDPVNQTEKPEMWRQCKISIKGLKTAATQ